MAAMWFNRTSAFFAFVATVPAMTLAACTVTSNVGALGSDALTRDGGNGGADAFDEATSDAAATDQFADGSTSNGCAPTVTQEGDWVSLVVVTSSSHITNGGTIAGGTYVLTNLRADDLGRTGTVEIRETIEITSSGAGGEIRGLTEKRNGSGDFGQMFEGESRYLWDRNGVYVNVMLECPTNPGPFTIGFEVQGDTLILDGQDLIRRTYKRVR